MIIEEIKKQNMIALKNHDTDVRAILSVIINKYMVMEVEYRAQNKTMTDNEVISIIQKSLKELEEEKNMYEKGGNASRVDGIKKQMEAIKNYLPKMMSEEEIKNIILTLEDKSIKVVMAFFKENYAGKVDMSLVSKVLRSLWFHIGRIVKWYNSGLQNHYWVFDSFFSRHKSIILRYLLVAHFLFFLLFF